MRVFNRYILFLVLATCIIDVSLAFGGQRDLTIYFTADIIAYLIITIIQAMMSPAARKLLSTVAIVLSAGFFIIAIFKAAEVFSKK